LRSASASPARWGRATALVDQAVVELKGYRSDEVPVLCLGVLVEPDRRPGGGRAILDRSSCGGCNPDALAVLVAPGAFTLLCLLALVPPLGRRRRRLGPGCGGQALVVRGGVLRVFQRSGRARSWAPPREMSIYIYITLDLGSPTPPRPQVTSWSLRRARHTLTAV